ncbi:hypothetical protein QGP82_12920 [Leptothoe sp. LEGE 181152]|nr:hypothetical protein [Leptothoe sp. LEGE 181152]
MDRSAGSVVGAVMGRFPCIFVRVRKAPKKLATLQRHQGGCKMLTAHQLVVQLEGLAGWGCWRTAISRS